MRTLPVPSDPVARLWHFATVLRIGGTEAHMLSALDSGIYPPESFGRIHHLPKERLAAVVDGLRDRQLRRRRGA